ncbi:hypothetical protein WMW72_18545 [Paenibacillus filicis]|uniref:Uncharacterized protein n=1 Tax=Paenibacillus filicis TaxID=669464 RepID=A0ABU9DM24_9BACL
MKEKRERYESLVEQEDKRLQQVQTSEALTMVILDYTYERAMDLDLLTAEELLGRVHRYTEELRLSLLHLRLEKAYVAGRLKAESR